MEIRQGGGKGCSRGSNILLLRVRFQQNRIDNNKIFGWENHLGMVFEKQGWDKQEL